MKKLLLIILAIVNINNSFSQSCPTINGTLQADVYSMQFNIGPIATTNINDYPATISILASNGVDIISYSKDLGGSFDNGIDNFVQYSSPSPQPFTGIKIDSNNFEVDFGLGAGTCTYIGGTLSNTEFNFSNQIKIHPNPSNDTSFINITSKSNLKITSVVIYDPLGKEVISKTMTSDIINISTLNKGLYLIKINVANKSLTKKLIIN